jgi:transposase
MLKGFQGRVFPGHPDDGRKFAAMLNRHPLKIRQRSKEMTLEKSSVRPGWVYWLVSILILAVMAGCAEVQVRTLPAPPPTAKLRVFIVPISTGEGWMVPHEKYGENMRAVARRHFERMKMYEVVPEESLKLVLEKSWYSGQDWMGRWSKNHWELTRKAGKALHAEYGVFTERCRREKNFFWRLVLVNIEAGRKFDVWMQVPGGGASRYEEIIQASYREIFRQAKEDMLATAIQKEQARAPGSLSRPSVPPAGKPVPSGRQTLPEEPGPSIDLEHVLKAEASAARGTRLAVYDLSTSEPFKVVALILSEALREEIFRMGGFSLVNRENMDQVLNEMGLQQTGLVEERQAVRAGKGLAAVQIVLGQFGVVGSMSVLQVKRIDVETQGTLGIGSLRCAKGREEELLAGLSDLARKLAGKK